jgi:hypothetical protein
MTVFSEHVWPDLPHGMDGIRCKVCGHRAGKHHFARPIICILCPGGHCQDGPVGEAYRESLSASARGPVGRTARDPKAPSE